MKKFIVLSLIGFLALCPIAFSASDTELEPKMDTISEKTSGSGVTIDGVLLKDGAVPASAMSALTAASAANTACSTTCGIATCIAATDGTNFVTCVDATADSCLCNGAIA